MSNDRNVIRENCFKTFGKHGFKQTKPLEKSDEYTNAKTGITIYCFWKQGSRSELNIAIHPELDYEPLLKLKGISLQRTRHKEGIRFGTSMSGFPHKYKDHEPANPKSRVGRMLSIQLLDGTTDGTSPLMDVLSILAKLKNKSQQTGSNLISFANPQIDGSGKSVPATAFTPEEMDCTKSDAKELDVALEGFEGEDQDVIAKRRINQGRFRKCLLRYWSGNCGVSDVADARLLVASHIVPWSKASKQERGDPANGLLLSVVWDALFDRGLISFRDNGSAILDKLDRNLLSALGISEAEASISGDKLTDRHKEYLKRHRLLFHFE